MIDLHLDTTTPEGLHLFEQLEKLKALEVQVGFFQGEKKATKRTKNGVTETDTDIVLVASWNEFGTSKIPPRPFFRESIDQAKQVLPAFWQSELKKIIKGQDAEVTLKRLGTLLKGMIQQHIVEGDFAPNAPSTIKKKGSSRPLIDTGRMRQSVTYRIVERGGD